MDETRDTLPQMVRQSLKDPRGVARRILSMQLPLPVVWEALALVVVLSGLAAHGSNMLADLLWGPSDVAIPAIFGSPLLLTLIQGGLLTLMAISVHYIGRAFGGGGELPGAVALVAWLQFLMVCLQVLQGLSMILLPGLSVLIGFAGIVLFFYLLTQFVCELHGFEKAGTVFAGIVISMFGIILGLSILLGILGIGIAGDLPDV